MSNLINIPLNSMTELSAAVVLMNILITLVLVLMISWVYQKTHTGISYSRSFLVSLVVIGILAAVAMMILSNNLVQALGVLGIFALIRFRTILKDTKDIAYLFFALTIGMAIGTNNYVIAGVSTPVICLLLLLFAKYDFGSSTRNGFLLTLITDGGFDIHSAETSMDPFVRNRQFMQARTQADGAQEFYFSIMFKKSSNPGDFVKEIKSISGVKSVELISGKNATEY
jgi:uncharacterized membrane protein YhiD involved in acid resistance